MTLERLDAIASGVLSTATGFVILVLTLFIAGERFNAWLRQEEVAGTVVRQEMSKVCKRAERGNALNCLRWENVACPIVKYQPGTGPLLTLKTCSQSLSVGTTVDVIYDRNAPTDARIASNTDLQWLPLLFAVVPLGVAGLMIVGGLLSLKTGGME